MSIFKTAFDDSTETDNFPVQIWCIIRPAELGFHFCYGSWNATLQTFSYNSMPKNKSLDNIEQPRVGEYDNCIFYIHIQIGHFYIWWTAVTQQQCNG